MNERCREMEDLLSPWRDGELDAERAREVAEHVADCSLCQSKVSAWHEAEAALAASVPSRSDLEWERLAQRVEEAIDADELERIAETLPAGEEPAVAAGAPEPAAAEPAVMTAAARSAGKAAPRRAAPPRRDLRWWAVGSGLAAAALVVLFWPWFQRPASVPPGPGALRERVGAAGRTDGTAKSDVAVRALGKADQLEDEVVASELGQAAPLEDEVAVLELGQAAPLEGDAAGPELGQAERKDANADQREYEVAAGTLEDLDTTVFEEKVAAAPVARAGLTRAEPPVEAHKKNEQETPAAAAPGSTPEEAAPLDRVEALGFAEGEESRNAPAAPDDSRMRKAVASSAVPRGAQSMQEIAEWMGGGSFSVSTPDARGVAPAPTPADALRAAHEARDAGDRERALEGYRLLSGDFPGNTVREEAWYSWTELRTEDVRAGSDLGPALEAGASLDAFRLEYPDSRYSRGVLASRVFVWARLVQLDPAYCDEAQERVLDWQTGIETAPLDVMRAVSVIADGCSR